MKTQYSAATDVGKKRAINEDAYLVDEQLNLFMVCDGMGGHAAGEVASAMAIEVVTDAIKKAASRIRTLAGGVGAERAELRKLLKAAVQMAGLQIYRRGKAEKEYRGMGTTLTLLLVAGPRAFVAHVGDSRLYLYRNGEPHLITSDHSLVNEMIRAGRIEPEEATKVPFTNALTRAVGVYPNVEVDTLELDLLPKDTFLICSDGLSQYLDGKKLREGFEQESADRSQWFVDYANDVGGHDNITCVVVEVGDTVDPQQTARLRLTLDAIKKIPLFQHLAYPEIVRIINVSRAREVGPDEVIIREGEEGDALFIVLEGLVTVERAGKVIATLGPRRHFGEMALVDNRPRSATIRTDKPCTLIRINRKDFYDLLRQDSVTAVKILWNFIQTMSARLRDVPVDSPSLPDELTVEEDPYTAGEKSFDFDAFAVTDPGIRKFKPLDET